MSKADPVKAYETRHAIQLLECRGIQPTPDNLAHLDVFLEAIRLYDERTSSYGQLWKQYGAMSNLLSMARKVDRIMSSWWHKGEVPLMHKDNLDDAYDELNYTAFFIRNVKALNITGEAPERPKEKP